GEAEVPSSAHHLGQGTRTRYRQEAASLARRSQKARRTRSLQRKELRSGPRWGPPTPRGTAEAPPSGPSPGPRFPAPPSAAAPSAATALQARSQGRRRGSKARARFEAACFAVRSLRTLLLRGLRVFRLGLAAVVQDLVQLFFEQAIFARSFDLEVAHAGALLL